MNAVCFAFTDQSLELARRIRTILGGETRVYVPERLLKDNCNTWKGSLSRFVGTVFENDALIFVGACGIAVRAIAPHIREKTGDPAVLCVDERGEFVIPILSGHIGGANRLARELTDALKATPVITTATDINGRFSVDEWAAREGFFISDMTLAKRVSAKILDEDIPICADAPLPDELPAGLVAGGSGPLGICVSPMLKMPFEETLLIVPRCLRVGIGCRRGISEAAVAAAVDGVFRENGLNMAAVTGAATIDVKAHESGLLDFCARRGWPLAFHSAEALSGVSGEFTPSEFVRSAVGVDNVCERAALMGGGRLIVRKRAMEGVTVAVALREWGIEFE